MKKMNNAVIVEVARTPIGKFRQSLANFEAPKLAAMAMKQIVEKSGIDPALIDDVIFSNLFNYNWVNMSRIALLEAGIPESVPGITINRQCSSSLNAVALAASQIMIGAMDVVLTGGVESYSKQPFMIKRPNAPFPAVMETEPVRIAPDCTGDPSMIETAENLAKKYGITREECDAFALESHRKASAAWDKGFFDGEVFPVEIPQRKKDPILFQKDECVRPESSMESLAGLRPIIPGGVVTAGNASPMNDGAAAVLMMSEEKASQLGLEPLAKVTAFAAAGVDPHIMGIGPVYATRRLMERTGLTIDDFDMIELNEAFASQSIACIRELNIDTTRLNLNGGAIAIGHPNAASGAILTARCARYMKQEGLNRALISFCCGGGQGFSCVLEKA